MENDHREHPGKVALQTIADSKDTTHLGYLAIQYLSERLDRLEKMAGGRNRAFTPPTPEEVTAYAASIKFALDGNSFCAYYEARNWCLGKVKMKSWQAAVRTWKIHDAERNPKKFDYSGTIPKANV